MYHIRVTLATTLRILRQLSHDHQTVGLIFVVPLMLLTLLYWLFSDTLAAFTRVAPALLALFPFVIMFIVTSITTLRERTNGTLERLMVSALGKLDFVVGYMLAFGLLAIIQAGLASVLLLYVFDLSVMGPGWMLMLVAFFDALLGTALGLFLSAFARTEFQAVQFMPAFIAPQMLIGGLLMPLANMPEVLERIAYFLPLTYAIEALTDITAHTGITGTAQRDVWIIASFIIGALLLAALSLRRKTD